MIDFSIFLTSEAWVSLGILVFMEIVLGVDNITFIAVTTNRLPKQKRPIGRKLGLAGAMVMRCLFLCFASWLVYMTQPLFEVNLGLYTHGFSIRDLLLTTGGVYLIYKGVQELRSMLSLEELRAEEGDVEDKQKREITLPQAVATIMVMDIVFSIDSVITAVGLAQHLIIMIIAVISAVLFMMIFIDAVGDFINNHPEIKILAFVFIVAIGVLLSTDGVGFHTGIEIKALGMPLEKVLVYFAMLFSLVLEIIQMVYNKRAGVLYAEREKALARAETTARLNARASELDRLRRDEEASFGRR